MKIYLTHLYPKQMSIYGDYGNILALQFMLKKLDLEFVYQTVDISQELPAQTDFYFIGGGQDKEQLVIYKDLLAKKNRLQADLAQEVAMLAICGGYQLLGKEFLTGNNETIPGLGILPITTKAASTQVKSRCVGNLIIDCLIPELKGTSLVGFENHSGQTFFDVDPEEAHPLGKVISGFGNNSTQEFEGCVKQNIVGTYMHGSCLPKNPILTKWFIEKILERKNHLPETKLAEIDSRIAQLAKAVILERNGSFN